MIRKLSAERYNIQLNAVAHDTYSTMFCYVRCPTAKKPVQELDATLFLSPGHPMGEDLQALLEKGEKFKRVRAAKNTSAELADEGFPVAPNSASENNYEMCLDR